MSRLNSAKIIRFIDTYMYECANDSAHYSPMYAANVDLNAYGRTFKELALCAMAKANEGQSGTNKINKQELYCCLFCMGFPLGLIAKTLLNANLAPVRNAVLLYKLPVINFIKTTTGYTSFLNKLRNATRISLTNFARNTVSYCGYVGGLPLIDKLIHGLDQQSLFTANNITGFRLLFAAAAELTAVIPMRDEWERSVGTRRGAVRRTGLTTSRVAITPQQTVQAVQSSTPTNPVIVQTTSLSTPAADAVQGAAATTTRQGRQLVRDVPIDTTTFGIEIEGSFITDGLDSVKRPSNTPFIDYMRKLVINENLQAKEYNKDMTVKRTGSLSMKLIDTPTPAGEVCWAYKSDLSVYGGTEKREIVSPILRGENGIKQLKLICSAMRRSGFYSNATAGVHVHLGVSGLDIETFKNLCYNYTMFEPLVDMIFPADRRWSNAYYAESFSKFSDWKQRIDNSRTFDELTRQWGGRYYKVNLNAFYSLGTVEFRQCIGTNDDRLIIWFFHYCFYLLEVSKRKRLTNFNLPNLQDILPAWAYTYFLDRVRSVSGYDIKYGYDIGQRGSTGDQRNTNTRGGDPMTSPLQTTRGNQKTRRGGWNQQRGNNDIFD